MRSPKKNKEVVPAGKGRMRGAEKSSTGASTGQGANMLHPKEAPEEEKGENKFRALTPHVRYSPSPKNGRRSSDDNSTRLDSHSGKKSTGRQFLLDYKGGACRSDAGLNWVRELSIRQGGKI